MAATKSKPPGRTLGSKNKVGATAKENILAVFTRLGGTSGMAVWAQQNPTEFYRIYAKLIPLDIDVDGALKGDITIRWMGAED